MRLVVDKPPCRQGLRKIAAINVSTSNRTARNALRGNRAMNERVPCDCIRFYVHRAITTKSVCFCAVGKSIISCVLLGFHLRSFARKTKLTVLLGWRNEPTELLAINRASAKALLQLFIFVYIEQHHGLFMHLCTFLLSHQLKVIECIGLMQVLNSSHFNSNSSRKNVFLKPPF